jgi:hypothetical protein
MTQADRVHSTPPTSSPVDPMRRRFLSTAAGVAAGGAALTLATVSATADAAAPMAALASSDVDPIFAAIERHRAARVIWDGEVDARSHFEDLKMTAEQRRQRDALDDAVADARDTLDEASVALINTGPTSFAGIVTMLQYLRRQMRDDGTYMPYDIEFEFDEGNEGGDGAVVFGWIDASLDTIVEALGNLPVTS